MTTPKMSAAASKFWADQKAADEAYKKWEEQQWQENGAEWTKQGYTRTVDPNNAWGSKWTKSDQPAIETQTTPPPVDPIKPALVSKTAAQWDAIGAQKFKELGLEGSGTMADVRKIQELIGLTGDQLDGKWSTVTQKAYDAWKASQPKSSVETPVAVGAAEQSNAIDQKAWQDHMQSLGYSGVDRGDGTMHFTDGNGNTYFNDGRMSSGSGMSNYDYTTLPKLQPKTTPQYDQYTTALLQYGKDAYRGDGELATYYNSAFGRYVLDKYGKDEHTKYAMHGDWDKHEDYYKLYDLYKNQFTRNNATWQERPLFGYKKYTRKNKQGGTMNRIKYFQQGGAAPSAQQGQADAFMQAILQGDPEAIQQLIQAANSGNNEAKQLVQTILQESEKGNTQVAKAAQVIMAALKPSAKWGSKLQYIRSLKYAKGGKTCPACQAMEKGAEVEMKKCGGKKAKKRYFGGYL